MASILTRAISIRQPYVEQILRGIKKWEYRDQDTRIRERVFLYASLKPGATRDWRKVRSRPGDLPIGKIVGTVEITGSRLLADGTYAYQLRAPKRLRKALIPVNQPQPRFWRPQFK